MAETDSGPRWRPSLGAWPEAGGFRFRVWAPKRRVVELVVEGPARCLELSLDREPTGHWSGWVEGLEVGSVYRYRLDGDGPFPDPASRFQPEGVHGPSQVVDPAFDWTDSGWPGVALEDLVLYELHVGAFTRDGTFAAVTDRLPALRDLGVTGVELMPLADFPGQRNWGYDGVDLFAPARSYGSPEDLRRLVDRAHALGMAVLLDVVYNHLGPDGAYLRQYSHRYFSRRHRTPWGPALNLDGEGCPQVRELLIENALCWTQEYHLDGLRFDACRTLVDESPRHLVAEVQSRTRQAAAPRRLLLIAEDSRNQVRLVQPEARGGWGLDGIWADDLHHQLRVGLAGDRDGYYRDFTGSLADTARTLEDGWFFQGQHSEHFGGPRGTDPRLVPPRHFVVCLQNHDQVGNRAHGERLHHQVDAASWRAASVLLLLAPETPLIFMGQEWGASSPFLFFTDHHRELGRRVREGRLRELSSFKSFSETSGRDRIPDPQAEATFTRSRLGWPEREREPHAGLLSLYRAALRLRRERALGHMERRDYRVVGQDGELVIEMNPPGRDSLLVVVRLGGAGVLESGESAAGEAGAGVDSWQLILSTEDPAFTGDSRPPVLGPGAPGSPFPRIAFRRAGAVVLSRPGPPGIGAGGTGWPPAVW